MHDAHNLLLTLASCGSLTSNHIQRLHFRERSEKTVKNRLTMLGGEGLIERQEWTNKAGVRQPALWSLTELGHKQIAGDAAYPGPGPKRAASMARHDSRLLEMIVHFLEQLQTHNLSGVKVFREIRLNPSPRTKKPILDGLIIAEVGGARLPDPNLIPWASPTSMPLADETLWRIGIEADNHTESAQTIAEKADNYQRVMNDDAWWAYWSKRFGPAAPFVFWGAPSHERAQEITQLWEKRWANGTWYVTHDTMMATNNWIIHEPGKTWPEWRHISYQPRAGSKPAKPQEQPPKPVVPTPRKETAAEQHERWLAQLAAREALPPRTAEELESAMAWDTEFSGAFDRYGHPLSHGTGGGIWDFNQLSQAEQATWLGYHAVRTAEQQQRDADAAAKRQAELVAKQQVDAKAKRDAEAKAAADAQWAAERKAEREARARELEEEKKTWRPGQIYRRAESKAYETPPAGGYVQADDGLWHHPTNIVAHGIRTMAERLEDERREGEQWRAANRRMMLRAVVIIVALILLALALRWGLG